MIRDVCNAQIYLDIHAVTCSVLFVKSVRCTYARGLYTGNHPDAVAIAQASLQNLAIKADQTVCSRHGCDHHNADTPYNGWDAVLVSNLVEQRDDDSCGVFMAAFAEMIMRGYGPPYCFCQADVPRIRLGMAAVMRGMPKNVRVTCAAADHRWAWKVAR